MAIELFLDADVRLKSLQVYLLSDRIPEELHAKSYNSSERVNCVQTIKEIDAWACL